MIKQKDIKDEDIIEEKVIIEDKPKEIIMVKNTIKQDKLKIINKKQSITFFIKNGYITLLPKEEVTIDPTSMTDDVQSKVDSGLMRIEKIVEIIDN